MADNEIGYNGNVYTLVPDPGEEGQAILERNAGYLHGTIICRLNNQPAIIVNGKFYIQGQRNYVPGSQGIWDRVFGRR